MTLQTQNYDYRGYEIQVTNYPPTWQAAIYATDPKMPKVDWTSKPIRAANVRGAEIEARRRIDSVLDKSN